MSREVPYNPIAICDVCGSIGAYDVKGDQLCQRCIDELDKDYSNKVDDDDDEPADD